MVNMVSMQDVIKILDSHTMVKKTTATEKPPIVTDRLELSKASIDLQQIKASGSPEVSQERLDALRIAIARGVYQVDPEKIAVAILRQNMIEI